MDLLNPDNVKWIILHCSASRYGNVELFTKWHEERGFSTIGYHWVITGLYPTYYSWKNKRPDIKYDGIIHKARSEKYKGAHVKGHNWESIGICLVGADGIFSARQLLNAAKLCHEISGRFHNIIGVKGHYEFTSYKTCPDLDVTYFTKYILPLGVEDEEVVRPIFDPTIINCNSGM